jgi:hypothetical protein
MALHPAHDVVLTIRAVKVGAFDDNRLEGSEIVKLRRMAINETRQAYIGWGSFYDAYVVGLTSPVVSEEWCANTSDDSVLVLMANLSHYPGQPPRLVATITRTTDTTWVVISDGVTGSARLGTEWTNCVEPRQDMWFIPLKFELTITKN